LLGLKGIIPTLKVEQFMLSLLAPSSFLHDEHGLSVTLALPQVVGVFIGPATALFILLVDLDNLLQLALELEHPVCRRVAFGVGAIYHRLQLA
jgi:hypothetical protein